MNILTLSFLFCFLFLFLIYWFCGKTAKIQNIIILIANSLLYLSWSKQAFLMLIVITLVSYFASRYIYISVKPLSKVIMISVVTILVGVLFVFKYFNFFAGEICKILAVDAIFISLVLPVGISFYIFTNMAYVIDIYRKIREPEKSILDYVSFITFFPLIMSGPIERSTTLLPQFKKKRQFDYKLVCDGAQQIVWGLFKKIVIADNCASVVNFVFPNYASQPASSLIIAAILYSFQIYFDFSGYSDIAIGFSKMLGFRVKLNFHFPYFSLNISDFWRRWHMSLQRWFTDYIYFPLGGSKCSKSRALLNTFIVFTICGIWHGANWTFLIWGIYNALLFVPYVIFFKNKTKKSIEDYKLIPSFSDLIQMIITFILVTIGWIIFNSTTLSDALLYISKCFDLNTIFVLPHGIGLSQIYFILVLLFAVFIFEWVEKDKEYALQARFPKVLKYSVLYLLIFLLIFKRAGTADFIYLQF